ncbi:uncharacterized protein LOC119595769 [Penaeus monodon]|uniref:uncharacterized protein LOC119595769 n=1 Tax=Penaeus monodon TaxID=6687 RepID=UPI0018A74814|nr:uncharacterized protein LOC119595769 [Penaeus monodon]
MAVMLLLLSFAILHLRVSASVKPPVFAEKQGILIQASDAVNAVLDTVSDSSCSLVLLSDGSTSSSSIYSVYQGMQSLAGPMGVGVFEVTRENLNDTGAQAGHIMKRVRELRLLSWCVTVLAVSEEPQFLVSVAEWAVRHRLLVWATRLLVLTRLPLEELKHIMVSHWTFSMMNSMVLNVEERTDSARCGVFAHLPYSDLGPSTVRVATWSRARGLQLLSPLSLFPQKFLNFYGATVNVTALPFPPYWDTVEESAPDGTTTKRFTGTDYLMLEAIAEALNFSIQVLSTANWDEVTDRVEDRTSFLANVIYAVFPNRLLRYDYSYMFEYAFHAFTMAKPALKPRWQSLYYPLTDGVWASILAVVIIMPLPLILIVRMGTGDFIKSAIGPKLAVQEIIRTLLGQDLSGYFPSTHSCRLLLALWLVFAFIVGTAYRGNLTASLTAPKYPARPETLKELVSAGARVTMPPYGAHFRDFFKQSDSSDFKTLGERVDIVPTAADGLEQAITRGQAHMEARRYLQLVIAQKFTRADGSTRLYVGRESVFPGLSAWPIPHDAPYKPVLDRCIMAIVEGGLYEKWSADMVSRAREESRQKQQLKTDAVESEEADGGTRALTLTHMQGPLLLTLLGLALAGVTFALEILVVWCLAART